MLLTVVKGQPLKSGIEVVTGSIDVRSMIGRATIPYRDALHKTGYQRKPQDTRITKFANELKKGNTDVPTSILLNMRGIPKIQPVNDVADAYYLDLEGDLVSDCKLYIVDGQHRYLAFKRLYDENQSRWGDYRLQFVLMLGANEVEEMNQFYIVNTTAKSVRTDLALDLLRQRAELDGRVMDDAISRGHDWKIKGQAICEKLNQESPIWKNKIRLANQEKGDTIIPAASFVTSLKRALTGSPFFKKLSVDQCVNIIDSYWLGIRKSLREPFDSDQNDYALQKGIGVTAMHEILPVVTEIIRSSGGSVFDEYAYEAVMEPVLSKLSGDNTEGENVSGAEFWLTAPLGGAAGSFSSSAGKRVLFAKLTGLLPELEIE